MSDPVTMMDFFAHLDYTELLSPPVLRYAEALLEPAANDTELDSAARMIRATLLNEREMNFNRLRIPCRHIFTSRTKFNCGGPWGACWSI